jgi:hypothetical protein
MKTRVVLVASLALSVTSLVSVESQAAENATNFYILGLKTTMAGFTPPPGTYLTDINYFYAGSASGNAAVGIASTGKSKFATSQSGHSSVRVGCPKSARSRHWAHGFTSPLFDLAVP